jgi:hypothetical protein
MDRCVRSGALSALVGLTLFLANTSASEDDLSKAPDLQGFRAALSDAYSEYSVFEWPASMRGHRKSPENFVSDVLFGDFNFDGAMDYSAKLTRPLTDDELADLPERHRDTINVVGVVVVCNGPNKDSTSDELHCTELTKERLGGSDGWLDLIDLTIWLDDLENQSEEYGNVDCPAKLRSPSGQNILSLVEPIGHCDAFFYPIESGGYGRCFYCAD